MKNNIQNCKDARWLALQCEILDRDGTRVNCGDSNCELFVHFKIFRPDLDPCEYPEDSLFNLCEECLAEERQLLGIALGCLSEAARKQFLSTQIDSIAGSLEAMKKPVDADSESVGEAISLWLRTPRLVEFMVEIYGRKLAAEGRRECADVERAK